MPYETLDGVDLSVPAFRRVKARYRAGLVRSEEKVSVFILIGLQETLTYKAHSLMTDGGEESGGTTARKAAPRTRV